MSIQRVGGLEEFDELADTTSWDRACDEDTDVSRVGRAEWNLQHKLPIEEVFPDR